MGRRYFEMFILGLLVSLMLVRPAAAAVTGASIDTGTAGSLTTVTISPDEDQVDDWAYIHFGSDGDGAFRVVVDTDDDGLFEPPDWSDPDAWMTADFTMDGWVLAGDAMEFMFEGRDSQWRVLPNGTYPIEIRVDVDGDWSTTGDQAVDTSLSVMIETASISGVVTAGESAVVDAEVHAGSQYGWGSGITAADGTYTISGLKAGSYHVETMKSGYVNAHYPSDVAVSTGQNTPNINFSLSPSVQMTGTISIPAAFDSFTNMWGGQEDQIWININAWTDDGSEWGWGNAHIHAQDSWVCTDEATDSDNDGIADVDECGAAAAYGVDVTPPPAGQEKTYYIRAEAEGYASAEYTVTVTETGGTHDVTMTKASRLFGTVTLPAPNATGQPIWIDINAKQADGTMIWGGGSVETGQTVGNFDIRSALAGTYTLEVRVWGYKTARITDVVVTAGEDKDLGNLTVEQGARISGTITIAGDTDNYKAWEGDDGSQPIYLWVDAWSPTSSGWSGTQVEIPRGTNQSVAYTIGGLNAGTYEVHSWLGEGYEQSPMPLITTLSTDSSQSTGVNMTFAPYSGAITGTISGTNDEGAPVDLSKVVIKATKGGWDWQMPVMAQPAGDGTYTLGGLGTSEYILEVGEYANAADVLNGDYPLPTGAFSTEVRRVSVMNGSTVSGQDIALTSASCILGTVSLEAGYGGAIDFAADIVGQMVMAVPLKMAMMGGSSMFGAPIFGDGSYAICGLSAGAYVVMPPTELLDPEAGIDPNAAMFQEAFTPDVAGDERVVAVAGGEDKTGVDFELSDGYSVSGTLTLPETPTGEDWEWVCDLELRHPRHDGQGRHMPVFVRDFREDPDNPASAMTRSFQFTLEHVVEGDYVLQAWTPNYVPGHRNISVSGSDVLGANLELSTGANIEGKLIDAETGEAITPADGVRVHCEAHPWVEGSWRETWNDPWSASRFLQVDQNGDETLDFDGTYTGAFRLANLPAGTYVLTVEAEHGRKQNGAKNYVGIRKAGIVVPDTDGATVDIGTLQLGEGVTISGTVTSAATGQPIGNIEVEAEPVDEKDGSTSSFAVTDSNGNYTIYGVDPEVKYYYIIGGTRPDFMDFMPVTWGEVEKDVTVPLNGLSDVDFELPVANATLSGTIHKTGSSPWGIPFEDDMPAPFLLLQKQGEIYTDPMDGIEFIGEPNETDTTTFSVDGVVPGTYTLKVYCLGYTTRVIRDLVISEGSNTLDETVELVEGGTVSGTVIKDDGTRPTLGEVSEAVAVSSDLEVIIFGTMTANEASREVTGYSISGLAPGATYRVVFLNDSDEGPEEIHVMPDAVQAGDTYDAVIGDTAPFFAARAKKEEDGSFKIGIFSTSYLNDADAAAVLSLTAGDGTLSATLGSDKMELTATYTPAETDTLFTIKITAHYGEENTEVVKSFSFDPNASAWNQGTVNTMMGGMVGMGQGDKSKVFLEAGDITDGDGDGVSTVTMQKDDAAVSGNALRTNRLPGRSLLAESTPDLPTYATAASALYDISLPAGDTITDGAAVTVSLEYDDSVTDTSGLHIYHYTGGAWVAEDTSRTVDTVNKTITADLTSLSPLVVAEGASPGGSGGGSTPVSSGGGGGGGCRLASQPVGWQNGIPETTLILLPLAVLFCLRLRKRLAERG